MTSAGGKRACWPCGQVADGWKIGFVFRLPGSLFFVLCFPWQGFMSEGKLFGRGYVSVCVYRGRVGWGVGLE